MTVAAATVPTSASTRVSTATVPASTRVAATAEMTGTAATKVSTAAHMSAATAKVRGRCVHRWGMHGGCGDMGWSRMHRRRCQVRGRRR